VEKLLPPIPAKRYFTIGEVSELCGVKPYVLRYWEQEFTQLKPMKRRGNRRYYQHHEVLLVRRIRELLYEQGFTISGARNRLSDQASRGLGSKNTARAEAAVPPLPEDAVLPADADRLPPDEEFASAPAETPSGAAPAAGGTGAREATAAAQPRLPVLTTAQLRSELAAIRELLSA